MRESSGVAFRQPLKGLPGCRLPVWPLLSKEGKAVTRKCGSKGRGFKIQCQQGTFLIGVADAMSGMLRVELEVDQATGFHTFAAVCLASFYVTVLP